MKKILEKLKHGQMSVDAAAKALEGEFRVVKIGKYIKHDAGREWRVGFPEVVYGQGKPNAQLRDVFRASILAKKTLVGTKMGPSMANTVMKMLEDDPTIQDKFVGSTKDVLKYFEVANMLMAFPPQGIDQELDDEEPAMVTIISGGTSDMQVVEEAAITLRMSGITPRVIHDVGVAGLSRLLQHIERINESKIVITVAGFEGALPSVVAGLIKPPIIAVPTSIGYGANFGGLAPLLAMLNSCAPGVSVVNIDNGFGAAVNAIKTIHRFDEN